MNRFLAAAAAIILATDYAGAAEIRLCDGPLRTVPLSDERDVQSALIQAMAVVNTGTEPIKLTDIRFQLKRGESVMESVHLFEPDIANALRLAPMISAIARQLPSQFCNGTMLAGMTLAKSAVLAPGEAVAFLHQPFMWRGSRDALTITAVTERGGAKSETQATLRVDSTRAKTQALYPIAGTSFAVVAGSFHTPHRWLVIEEFAYDIVAVGAGGKTHRGSGARLSDYFVFGRPVRAVAAGTVVRVGASMPDNVAMLKRADETDTAYFARLMTSQGELIARGIEAVLGNHVVIDHGNGEYSVYAHLKMGSARVALDQRVEAGETIGTVGSSGNSTEPHLHFQICDNADMNRCRTIPVTFQGIRLPLDFGPRTLQSGDVVVTER